VEHVFAQVLDRCIDRIARGESIELCLRDYPGHAPELGPLLCVAGTIRRAAAVDPRPGFKAWARAEIRSVLYERAPERGPRTVHPTGQTKSQVAGWLAGLLWRPAWQKALAGAVAVAIVIALCLGIPALLGQSSVALAEELAMGDPGVQILLTETGFDPSSVRAVAVKSGAEDLYHVYLAGPAGDAPLGTVTVDTRNRTVTRVGLVVSSEEYVQPRGVGATVIENVIEAAQRDARVERLMAAGAEVGRATFLSSVASPEKQVVGLELRLGGDSWLLKMNPGEGRVMSIFERRSGQ